MQHKAQFFPAFCLYHGCSRQSKKGNSTVYFERWGGHVLSPAMHRILCPKMLRDHCRPKSEQFLNPYLCSIFKNVKGCYCGSYFFGSDIKKTCLEILLDNESAASTLHIVHTSISNLAFPSYTIKQGAKAVA